MERKICYSDEELTQTLRRVVNIADAEFMDEQLEIIRTILSGRDVLAILPTSLGKSVCYQVPAMFLPGVTLVISPLIALMQEQAERLYERGIPVACLSSDFILDHNGPHPLRRKENGEESKGSRTLRNQIFLDAVRGKDRAYKIIYLTPERLRTGPFIRFAQHAEISMIAVDEAHCISLWGYDFRPRYLEISRLIKRIGYHPVIAAFTATAPKYIKDDIVKYLDMDKPKLFRSRRKRDNLTFEVWNNDCDGAVAVNEKGQHLYPRSFLRRISSIVAFLRKHEKESGVIYCASASYAEHVFMQLNDRGFSAAFYDTGPNENEKKQAKSNRNSIDAFQAGKKMILITDSASGLEIDKKDIRFVIHFNLPDSPENYYRQIICAGQDGHQASCILCYAGADDLIVSEELRQSSFVAELTSNELAEHIEQAKQSGTRASTELRKYILPKLRESIPSEERNERKNLKFTVWNDICENSNPVLLRKQKSCDKKHIYPRSFWCRLNIIVDFLNAHPEDSCVIYCTTKDYVNQVYKQLRYKRLPVTRYYASLDKDKKNKKSKESKKTNMAAFESGEKKIIVSTSALGMGIDKQDIRFVIHFNLPTCLEDYYQQAGRAGRDNAPARCILCYAGADDLEICRTLINASTFRTELKGETLDIHKRIKEQRLEKMLLYGQMCFTLSNVRKPSVVLEKEIDRYFKEFEPIISSDELKTSKKNIRRIINRVDVLYVNRTKIAQELRKGHLQGKDLVVGRNKNEAVRTVSYSVEVPKSSEPTEPEGLSYFDLMVADAVYTLMKHRVPAIYARNVMELLSGVDGLTLQPDRKVEVDKSIKKLMQTQITIDRRKSRYFGFMYDDERDLTVMQGAFLPLEVKENGFSYDPARLPPLYHYAEILNGQFFSLPTRELRKVFGRYDDFLVTTCTVFFDANGGTGTMNNASVKKHSYYSLPANSFTAPGGKVFDSWMIGNNSYAVGDIFNVSADSTVVAMWKDKPSTPQPPTYTVTVKHGTGGGDYAVGMTVTVKSDKAPSGKQFKAWTGADGLVFTSGNAFTSKATFSMPASVVMLTATYDECIVLPTSAENLAIVHYILCRIGSMNRFYYTPEKTSKKELSAGSNAPAGDSKEKTKRHSHAFTAPVIRLDTMVEVLQIGPQEDAYYFQRKLKNLWIKMQAVLAVLMQDEYYKIDQDAHKILFLLFRNQRKAIEGESEQNESTQEETTEPKTFCASASQS